MKTIILFFLAISLIACRNTVDEGCNETEYCILIINSHKYYDHVQHEKKAFSHHLNPYSIWKALIEVDPCTHHDLRKKDFFTDTTNLRYGSQLKNKKISYFYNDNNLLDSIYIDLNNSISRKNYDFIKDLLYILNGYHEIDNKKLEIFLESIQLGQPDEDDQNFISNKTSFGQINIAGFQIIGTKEIRLIIYKTK